MSVRKTNWGWIVDFTFTHADGRRERVRQKSPVQTRRGAEVFERQLREQMLVPQPENRKEVPTLQEFSQEFMATYARVNNKPSEIVSKNYALRRYLLPQLGARCLDSITRRDVEGLKARLMDHGLSPKTSNNVVAVLSKILRYAEEIELIDKVPRFKLMKVPEPTFDFLDFAETRRLLDAARDQDWRIMILTALRTGLRFGELCELRWADVDLVAGRLVVRRSYVRGHVGTPKSGKGREIPLSPETGQALKAHRHLRGELVFCKPDGGRRIHRRADVALKKICRRAGLRSIGWHVLRHTFASHLVMRGVPLKAVQELLGHSTIQMTMRYAHLAPSAKQEAVAVLDATARQYGGSEATPGRQLGVTSREN